MKPDATVRDASRGAEPVGVAPAHSPVLLLRPGLVEYGAAWDLQRALAAARRDDRIGDSLILLEHPHVYTLGRNADEAHVLVDASRLAELGATLFRIDRGGDVTYHGPGQLVGYPILDLRARGADVHRYVREIEEVIIRALSDFGIASERVAGLPGVWVGREKVAAIGVKIARWISGHGFALNVCTDLSYFGHIVPCGLHDRGVTSISRLLGREVTVDEARERVEARFAEVFGRSLAPIDDVAGLVERLSGTD